MMDPLYFVTGAAGHLGSAVVRELVRLHRRVRIFLLPEETNRVEGVEKVYRGDVRQRAHLIPVFEEAKAEDLVVIHCAGIVSIQSRFSQEMADVNVGGTKNVVDLCAEYAAHRLVYISSVHAIPEGPPGQLISETNEFDPAAVEGHYAKSKAEATTCVLAAGGRGLPVNVILPSGLIGPYDYGHGHMTTLIEDVANHRLAAGMAGGYDFADVRDAAKGIIACCDKGRPGACYILSNRYYTVRELLNMLKTITGNPSIRTDLPFWFVRLTAPLAELYYKILRRIPLYTSYSIYTLATDSHFSHAKADRELGYTTRPMEETLKDTYQWLRKQGRIRS